MIKTAIIIERTDIALGGAERSIAELSEALSAKGVDVRILAATGQSESPNVEILCQNAPAKRISFADFGKAILNHLDNEHYDIIHSTLPFAFADIYQPRGGSCREAMLRNAESYENPIARCIKKQTHFLNFRRTPLLNAEHKLCNADKTIVAALSEYVKRQFQEHYNLPDKRIAVIPNGIALPEKIDTEAAHKFKRQILVPLPIEDRLESSLFLFAANNFRLKGLASLIQALSLLNNNKTVLLVAGSGKQPKYRALAKRLGVEDRVIFLGPLPDIQQALSIADVAVLPTYYDPCSRFILEALAQAKPVITTQFNGAAERYTDNRHGKIIDDPRNIKALVVAMDHLSQTQNAQEAADAIITDNLRDQISIAKHAERMVQLYETIASERTTD